jgi:hypothetical protein
MDECMSRLGFAACALVLASHATAQGLGDPTRPPAASDVQAGDEIAPASGRLQSILLSPARRFAVIDGTAVTVGGRVGEATVVEIRAAEVVLSEGGEERVLTMHPDVNKKTKKAAAAFSGPGGKQ